MMSKEIRKTIFLVGLMVMGIVAIAYAGAITFNWVGDKQVIQTKADLSVYGIDKARLINYFPFITDVTKENGITTITLSSDAVMVNWIEEKEELIRIIELTEDAEIQEKLTNVAVQQALVLKGDEGGMYDCILDEQGGAFNGFNCVKR